MDCIADHAMSPTPHRAVVRGDRSSDASEGPSNDALQRTGTALHLSPVKSLARLHRRSKAAPAAERNVGTTKTTEGRSQSAPE